ncbi:MAG: S41 family peptidase [Rickettsiales bacterium]|jgi:carboxyl-terminal processing protease|nr:S41 family peptidase [Rickettsiales bacterium]
MFKKILASALISISVVSGVIAADAEKKEPIKHLTDEQIYEHLKKFALVFEAARENYVEEVDEKKLLEAAMNGMLASMDPHSSYLNAEEMKDFTDKSHGEFGGLGIQITADKGVIRVISPIDDTPAARAGIKAGDYVTHIDGEQVGGLTLNQAVKKMKGRPGTKVKLTIMQPGSDPRTITLRRAIIKVKSIKYEVKDDDVGYIRISDFGATTSRELKDAVAALEKKKVKGYIIDVRNNPGGYLTAAIDVADAFLDSGDIVSTRGRDKGDIEVSMAKPGDFANGKPIAVLVNHGSASASEIVAGALQDNNRAIVMGAQTFGKGSVQQQKPMGDGTAIHLTIARYYTPNGVSIQAKGITPDVEVLQSKVEVLEKKRDIFSEATLVGALKNDDDKSDREKRKKEDGKDGEEDKKSDKDDGDEFDFRFGGKNDYQLSRAIDMVRAMAKIESKEKPAPEDKEDKGKK